MAERFGQSPEDVLGWDASVMRMLHIESLGRPDDDQPEQPAV